jgi:hypothetical protein
MNKKLATALLRQRDDRQRRRMLFTYSGLLGLLFLAHSFFTHLSSPLKLIPQTAAAISMGFFLVHIVSLRRFNEVAEFIDWARVAEAAGQSAATRGGGSEAVEGLSGPEGKQPPK